VTEHQNALSQMQHEKLTILNNLEAQIETATARHQSIADAIAICQKAVAAL